MPDSLQISNGVNTINPRPFTTESKSLRVIEFRSSGVKRFKDSNSQTLKLPKLLNCLLIFSLCLCASVVCCGFAVSAFSADDYLKVKGVIDVESNISGGLYSINRLAEMAKEKGLKVVIFGDTALARWEYGIPPFRRLIKKTFQKQSVFKFGIRNFLNRIKAARHDFPEIIFIPGVEVAADYYWSGSPFKEDFTMHNWHRHILVIGLENEGDYKALPIKYDPYNGDRGALPYQRVIDYVNERGGLTFWAHPEAELGRIVSSIRIETKPYPDLLKDAQGYTGFASLYQDNITITEPGQGWDRLLLEYCKGERKTPVWGIGEIDFEGSSKEKRIDSIQTIFLVRKMTKEDILDALKKGRCFALLKGDKGEIILDEFSVRSGNDIATMGEELIVNEEVRLILKVSENPSSQNSKLSIRIVKNGYPLRTLELAAPVNIEFEDKDLKKDERAYYRADISSGEFGRVLTNPIFVRNINSNHE